MSNVELASFMELTRYPFIRYNVCSDVDGGRHLFKGRKYMVLSEKNFRRTWLSILLAVVCLLSSFLSLYINARAYNVIKTGTVINVSSRLNFRSGPGTGNPRVGYLYSGNTGTIEDEGRDSDGDLWYKMTISGVTGWAHSSYIQVTTTVVGDDVDFETYMTAQGFPESYKEQLRVLHAQYPNWVFQAQHTNLTWAEVIAAESALGKNLVHAGADTSWKSTQNGAYDWETGKWVVFDSGGWVAASTEIIQYFMDPRNFLDTTSVFQFLRQSYNASEYDEAGLAQIRAGLTTMVANTYLMGNCDDQSYVDVIMSVAAEKGVSPYVLASMMIQEIGVNGDSGSISGTVPGYEGYYNYFNVGAYKTDTLSAIQKGLSYAKGSGSYGRPWDTRYKSIAGGAEYYANGYVKKGQDTMYLKKFNVQGSNLYGHQYMTNVQGANSEGRHMAKAYDENARQGSLTFRIPIYLNMPTTACAKPSGNGNPNYMLKSLEVAGYSLTPTFNMYETSYSLIVPNEVTSVTINAQALAETTSVAGTGAHNLNVGSNVFNITTTAQNGTQRTYAVTIMRQEVVAPEPPKEPEPPVVVIPTPSISTPTYQMNSDNTITGITDFPISVDTFKTKFSAENGTVKVTTANGTEKSSTSNVGTGDQIRVYDNEGVHKFTYTILIYGDTNGDGQVDMIDLALIQRDILEIKGLTSYYKQAADTSKNNVIDMIDLAQVLRCVLEIKSIQQ